MRYLSLFSGIEAATQAFAPLGWEPAAFAETEAFPSAVLKHHHPNVPNLGDVTKFKEWPNIGTVDLICGGSPCQAFSVAGMRQGMADPRGNLALTYLAIVDHYRPRWVLYENVPGLLSSNGGRDFGAFLGGLGQLGYGVAYRVLDSQYVRTCRFSRAVPQRRRRVWVVGYLGDWRRAAAVLFDRESLSGHPAPRREAGKGFARDVVPSLTGSGRGVDRAGESRGQDPVVGVICANSGEVGYCLTASAQQSLDAETETLLAVTHALRGEGFDASEDGTGRRTPIVPVAYRIAGDGAAYEEGSIAAPLTTGTDKSASLLAFQDRFRGDDGRGYDRPPPVSLGVTGSLETVKQWHVATSWAVRRLTPRETERLQGFPDDFTKVPGASKGGWREVDETEDVEELRAAGMPIKLHGNTWHVKDADGPRYKAIGNSWAVNCADWIGERIAEVDKW